jgi:hypothetical protein
MEYGDRSWYVCPHTEYILVESKTLPYESNPLQKKTEDWIAINVVRVNQLLTRRKNWSNAKRSKPKQTKELLPEGLGLRLGLGLGC